MPVVNSESSTATGVSSEAVSADSDSAHFLATVLERTLNSVRDASQNDSNLQFINRMTTARKLPSFAESPWLNLKEVYELTTEGRV